MERLECTGTNTYYIHTTVPRRLDNTSVETIEISHHVWDWSLVQQTLMP
jgi:hypothetical protein